ncbi:AI-2E family transporter [Stenomitos frigidus ULC18]|uniref:AI-2E family transporter n=1 Tax=Stenomitos frigidus ULC18 TaxID=2107698 RepID=A0A2T1DV46_9CYAN|nr:AI-2E family transporter [Stenomitos frigidus ULC18]
MHKGRLRLWWETLSPVAKALLIMLAAPLLVLNGWAIFAIADYFHSLIVILVGASLIAFLLNYPVSIMQRQGVPRGRAAIIVFLLALSVLLAGGITLVPSALDQARQLVARLPEWFDSGQRQLIILNQQLEGTNLPLDLSLLAEQVNDRLKSQLQLIAAQVLSVAVFTVTSLLDVLLTLVLTFYLLQNGDQLWESLVGWLPDKVQKPFSETLRLSFQNYFLSQIILSTCMGSILTLIFLWLAVPFGLLFGLTIGAMALVPFGGSVGIALVTLLVALRDIGLGVKVLAASLIVQQILENLVAPRVLGSVTGLNPVWIFVSILTGARVGGLLGVIVAVPTAVVVKNILVAVRSSRGTGGARSHSASNLVTHREVALSQETEAIEPLNTPHGEPATNEQAPVKERL